MNKLEYELLNNYLEQMSSKAENTINELRLIMQHINGFKSQLIKREISEKTRAHIPEQTLSIVQTQIREKQPSDLIRIKEVMSMTGLSRPSIYTQKTKVNSPDQYI